MLRKKTVFVVGAGASKELNLPVGEDLKSMIADALLVPESGYPRRFENVDIQRAVEALSIDSSGHDPEEYAGYIEAARAIRNALPFALSIDQYLDSQRMNMRVIRLGKIAIANSILRAERDSLIASAGITFSGSKPISRAPDWGSLKTWHLKLVQLLTAGRPRSEMLNIFEDVAFIIFNYDRCLEFYFQNAISNYYNADIQKIHHTLGQVEIIHPYGQVGFLDWQQGERVPYGGRAEHSLHLVADGLKTFTESAEDGVTSKVKGLVEEAETLVFMGFGYLPQNVDLLRTFKISKVERIFYTTYGISRSDIEFVEQDLEFIVGKKSHVVDTPQTFRKFEEAGKCADLMNNNWMRLTR